MSRSFISIVQQAEKNRRQIKAIKSITIKCLLPLNRDTYFFEIEFFNTFW